MSLPTHSGYEKETLRRRERPRLAAPACGGTGCAGILYSSADKQMPLLKDLFEGFVSSYTMF
jgi:hypothetical protein